jgi:hypothetical protein
MKGSRRRLGKQARHKKAFLRSVSEMSIILYSGVPESPLSPQSPLEEMDSTQISSRGDGLNPNLLYPLLEEEGPPLFPQFS